MINYYKDFTQNPETEDNLSRYINYHPGKSKSRLDDIYNSKKPKSKYFRSGYGTRLRSQSINSSSVESPIKLSNFGKRSMFHHPSKTVKFSFL